jgi:multidrug efflux pump subunit AcrB
MPIAKGSDGYVVRLGDVAKVALESSERRAYYHSNGEPALGIGIVKTSTANSLDVAEAAKAEAERIKGTCRPAPTSTSPSTAPPSFRRRWSASTRRWSKPWCWCCW